MEEQNTAAVEATEASEGTQETSGDATGSEEQSQSQPNRGERTFTKAEVEAQIKERLERDRKKQSQKAEEKAAEARAEWEQLAKTRAERIAELEPATERVEALEGIVQKYVDSERQGLPKHILTLLDKMPVEEQLEYIVENRDDLKPQVVEEAAPQRRVAPDATRNQSRGTPYDREKNQFNQILRQRGLRQ